VPERTNRRLARLRHRQARQRTAEPGSTPETGGPTDGAPPSDVDIASPDRAAEVEAGRLGVREARARLWRALVHPGPGQLVIAGLLFLLGMAGVLQIRSNAADDAYTTARREDLVQLLDGLGQESQRLEAEIAELERTRTQLRSGADIDRVAREQAQQRLNELSILAGTAPAQGPGIRMRIADPNNLVESTVLLDAVEELRDAGAEVIEINDQVRVVASTWFGQNGNVLVIDGQVVERPLVVEAIGEPHSLEEGAQFRGGIVSEITGPRIGGQVQIEQLDRVLVTSLHSLTPHRYARPAASSSPR
jgi:uncharacterized protein YlxW (UPF0749 family)